jgi:putative heme-binding domain-containing protein
MGFTTYEAGAMKMWALTFCLGVVMASGVYAQVQNGSSPDKSAVETSGLGDPARGQTLFEGKGGCTSCHRVGDTGSVLGPNLSEIGQQRTADQLKKSLLDPDATVLPKNQLYRVVTRGGKTITGKLLNQDTYSLQMLDSQGKLVAFQRADLRETGFAQTPPMPSYRDKLSSEEQADLLAYLASLKSVTPH